MLFTVVLSTAAMFVAPRNRSVKLDLYQGKVLIGHGIYREDYKRGGNRESTFKIDGTSGSGGTLSIEQIKTIDPNAYPISEDETVTEVAGKTKSITKYHLTYNKAGEAVLEVSHNGHKSSSQVIGLGRLSGYSTADKSDLWFVKTFPTVGTRVTSAVFDIESSQWQKVQTTYLQQKYITVGGNSIEAYEVEDVRDGERRMVYLDMEGMPVLMMHGPYRTEIHFDK